MSAELKKKKIFIRELDQEIRRVTHPFTYKKFSPQLFSTNIFSSPDSTSGIKFAMAKIFKICKLTDKSSWRGLRLREKAIRCPRMWIRMPRLM